MSRVWPWLTPWSVWDLELGYWLMFAMQYDADRTGG